MAIMLDIASGHKVFLCMAYCTSPLILHIRPDGSSRLGYPDHDGEDCPTYTVPCGSCTGCTMSYTTQWIARGTMELITTGYHRPSSAPHPWDGHYNATFATLTYDESHLPDICEDDFQLFVKRLRKSMGTAKVRYIYAYEYGTRSRRPHYHAIFYGYTPPAPYHYSADDYYTDDSLQRLWGHGFISLAPVNPANIGYVAHYVTKSLDRKAELAAAGLPPEYIRFSRRPGIGHDYLVRYYQDIYAETPAKISDKVTLYKIPRYYDKLMADIDPMLLDWHKAQRLARLHNRTDSELHAAADTYAIRLARAKEAKSKI